MRQAIHRPHSIFCILPPYILRSISKNGTPQQRDVALQTLASDTTFRSLRVSLRPTAPAAKRRMRALAVEGQKQRTIYDAHNVETLPGDVVRSEGQGDTGDAAVDEAYHGLGTTFDFFWEAYDRDSIDDEGMPLDATVHYGQAYDNAFWNGQRMVFGDGDGELFNRFTIALDIIAHELGHGVVEDEAALIYYGKAGAVNESIADVFGSLVKQKALRQTADQADWLIGAGLFTANVQGEALRSMKAPGTAYDDPILGKDPQPAYLKDYVNTWQDNGGVHINSGIPNHAFYRVAIRLGGYVWERAGRIWYEALRDPRLRPNAGFRRFSRVTFDVANRIYGVDSAESQAVRDGWAQVGIQIR